jgi:4-amino-4-deoxy-L-arabinose transferase-like glycosyltransferase
MKGFFLKYSIPFAAIAWLILGLLQAYFTELSGDEAYYWMYSRYMDWGYHDHPPMIAAMIRLGYALFPHEGGVRLLTVFANTAALCLLYQMTDKKRPLLFLALLFSLVSFHASALLAVPDSPLLLGCVCYFWVLRRYIHRDTFWHTLLLAATVTFMLYSKYHSGMVLFFTLLAIPSLLRRASFWAIVAMSLVLYSPHLYWMYAHDFSSLKFHLGFRSKEFYTLGHFGSYWGGLLTISGPLVGVILLPSAYRYSPQDMWEKALKYCFIGIIVLLFVLHFQTHIEANWFGTAIVPTILLSYRYLSQNLTYQRYLRYLAVPSLILALVLRIYLVYDFLPKSWRVASDYHGWSKWAVDLQKANDGLPLVFSNSYQLPAKYTFYTGQMAYAANNIHYHRTQYDFWNIEDAIQDSVVKIVLNYEFPAFQQFYSDNFQHHAINKVLHFPFFGKVTITEKYPLASFPADTTLTIPLLLTYPGSVNLNKNEHCAPRIQYSFFSGNKEVLSG